MGVTITEDESDKKIRGAREIRKEMVHRHKADTTMAEELAERDDQINRTRLSDPDPAYAYRLVNRAKDGEQIALRQGMGYETVPETDKTKLVMSSPKDGTQVQGDLVLMRTPIENYERHRALRRRRWERMSGDKIESTKENLNRIARDGGLSGAHKDAVLDE